MMPRRRFGQVKVPFKRIHLELTNVCDFNCVFCPKSVMTRPLGYMDPELARRTISEIKALDLAEKITFHVMGEPTLHPHFFDLLGHAQEEGVKVGLTTNGGGLGDRVGRRLLDRELHQIDVSLQTPDEESFALRRARSLDFETYLSGVMDFFAAYRADHPRTIFKFRFLNTRFRQRSMERKIGPVRVMSSTRELRATLGQWLETIHRRLGLAPSETARALKKAAKLVSYKWNVVEVLPNVFFETYVLEDWGHAFHDGPIHDAWAGYCFGLRDHFAILYNGDVTLCCIDYDGRTAVGNLHQASLADILTSEEVGRIAASFRRFKPVHPYCKRCLGGKTRASWLFKPAAGLVGLWLLKPFFYHRTRLF